MIHLVICFYDWKKLSIVEQLLIDM